MSATFRVDMFAASFLDELLQGWAPEPWMSEAVCAQADPEIFFPEKGQNSKDARMICRMCPVREECKDYALRNDERFGVWGDTSVRERERALGRRRAEWAEDWLDEVTA